MRAVRVNGKTPDETHLVDATGGLGVDAFMFASAGYKVTVLEKNPLVFTLLSDAYQRAQQVPKLKPILERMSLVHVDALDWFKQNANTENAPDVIYLDPMYPIESKMKATPKKGMALARALVGRIDRADELVKAAVTCSKEKTVLKRPYYATASIGTLTHFKSRSVRFEVFTSESWSSVGAPDIERVPATSTRRLLSL
jgi:16S rRNA (guanine1516-N2)-methyltransferase